MSSSSNFAHDSFIDSMTASNIRLSMHRALFILTLTFIQGHTDLNHEKKFINRISESFSTSKSSSKEDSQSD